MIGRMRRALRQWRRRDVERELEEELRFHLDRTVEELEARGWSRPRARDEAKRRFGDVARYRHETAARDRRTEAGRRWLVAAAELVDDVVHAGRRVIRSPGATAMVLLILALGIGANATMYSVLDRILLSPPPHIAEPEAVKRLFVERNVSFMAERHVSDALAYADYEDLRTVRAFASVAAYGDHELVMGSGTDAERLVTTLATGSYFSTLGTRSALGRFFDGEDDRLGAEPVAVISHDLWRRRFGGGRDVLGERIRFGTFDATIVGVAPRGFTGLDLRPVDVWIPALPTGPRIFEGDAWRTGRAWYSFKVVARLDDGVAASAAEAEATAAHRRGREAAGGRGSYDPQARVVTASVVRTRGPNAPAEATVARWLGGVTFVLLVIACANVANLLLARALRQQRESAVRLALGISHGRLLRQVVLESTLLALMGAAAALAVAFAMGPALGHLLFPDVAWRDAAAPARVILFTAGIALVAGALTGAVPALQTLRSARARNLGVGGGGVTRARSAIRMGLVAFQAALSVALLAGAGLFVRSLHGVRGLDLGFEPEGVIVIEPHLDPALDDPARRAFFRRAEQMLEHLPGVARSTFGATAPFWDRRVGYSLTIPGVDSIPALSTGGPTLNAVEADYFDVLRQRLARGRGFTAADDRPDAAPVAVIGQTMARRIPWPGGDAIGQCMRLGRGADRPCITIVGIVRDARRASVIEDETLQYYVPAGSGLVSMLPEALLVRGSLPPERLVRSIRQALHGTEPGLRYVHVREMNELVDPDLRSWTLGATMFSTFGALALLVAALGLYSVLAFDVAQRRRELGIRAALGAPAMRLVAMMVREGMAVVALGLAVGLAVAALVAPHLRELLFEVSPRDPLVLGGVTATLLLVAGLASLLPSIQATRIDPQTALRSD